MGCKERGSDSGLAIGHSSLTTELGKKNGSLHNYLEIQMERQNDEKIHKRW